MTEKEDIFHKRCGEILRLAQHLESTLTFFISNYFVYPQNYKTFLLGDSVIIKLNFERKIEVFKEICKHEEIDKKKLDKILHAIRHVQKIRNKVAHFEALVHDPKIGEISLWSAKSCKPKKDVVKLTEGVVEKVRKNTFFAAKQITRLHAKLSNSRRNLE